MSLFHSQLPTHNRTTRISFMLERNQNLTTHNQTLDDSTFSQNLEKNKRRRHLNPYMVLTNEDKAGFDETHSSMLRLRQLRLSHISRHDCVEPAQWVLRNSSATQSNIFFNNTTLFNMNHYLKVTDPRTISKHGYYTGSTLLPHNEITFFSNPCPLFMS